MSLLEGISFGGKGNDGDKVSEEGPNKRRRLDLAADDLFGAGSKKTSFREMQMNRRKSEKESKKAHKQRKEKKEKKDKKHKKEKRSKREKKAKKERHRSSRGARDRGRDESESSSSSSDDGSDREREAPPAAQQFQQPPAERMGWMSDPLAGIVHASKPREEPRKKRREEETAAKSGVLAVEDLPFGLYDPKAAKRGASTSSFGASSEFDRLVAGEPEQSPDRGSPEPSRPLSPSMQQQVERLQAWREGKDVPVEESTSASSHTAPPTSTPQARPATAEELNKISSKLMRARMKGDKERVAKLEAQLEAARAGVPIGGSEAPAETVEVVSTLDERGRPISILNKAKPSIVREDLKTGSRKGKTSPYVNMADREGRKAYFRDDNVSLEELVRRERETGPEDMDATMARNIVNMGRKYKMTSDSRAGADEDEDVDMKIIEGKDARLTEAALYEKEKKKAVLRQRRMDMARERCFYCFKGPAFQRHKHLLIALGEHTMLMFPPLGSRVPGHILIVPLEHIPSWLDADENAWNEMMMFKSSLYQMFSSKGEDVLFMETSIKRHRQRHAVIDVIPMDKEVAADAPIYFQKAMMEVEEWTSHKKVIDITGKGLRRCIPQGFPYFHVAWKGGGFAHVIEDENEFPPSFGVDIAAGMMGLPPERFGRKAQRPSFDEERKRVLKFVDEFEPYDWTQQLDG